MSFADRTSTQPPASDPSDADFDALAAHVTDLDTRVDTIEAITVKCYDALFVEPEFHWAWQDLTLEQTRERFQTLREWVDWLVVRYALTESTRVPPCWYQHPVAVEELTALWSAWLAAYRTTKHPTQELINWHDRWLWPCLTRLNGPLRVFSGCQNGEHVDRAVAGVRVDSDRFDTFLLNLEDASTEDTVPIM